MKGYSEQIKEIKAERAKRKMTNDISNSTLIGYKGSTGVYTPDNANHIFICGTTGSGKTVALSNFMNQAFSKNYPALIVDGKGDIGDNSILDIMNTFQKKSKRKTYIINLTDPTRSSKYNPFQNANASVVKDMMINLSDWSEQHYKVNTERYLQRVIQLMELQGIPFSFGMILKYIPVDQFITLSMELSKQGIITKEYHLENISLSKISGPIAEGAEARFSLLAESSLGTIFDDDGVDIYSALKENAIIVFILNPLLYPETSVLMGRLILIDSKKAVSHLFTENKRTFFILDELNSYVSSVLIDLVNKSRSAGVTCILAVQSLSALEKKEESFKQEIIENCNNYIILRQNSSDNAEEWANIVGTRKSIDTTYQIGDKEGRSRPTGMGTMKFTREYIFHPDTIKYLRRGEAIFVSKDTGEKTKLNIHKPF